MAAWRSTGPGEGTCPEENVLGAPAGRPERRLGRHLVRGSVSYLMYQSTAFHVGPAWVGLAKKLPTLGLMSSTFFR
jgi:hypothetical protein